MKRVFLGTILNACVLPGAALAYYHPYDSNPYDHSYRSERTERQMDQLQRDIDRMPRNGHMKPDGSGGYYYTY
jgi:hypothetical protein